MVYFLGFKTLCTFPTKGIVWHLFLEQAHFNIQIDAHVLNVSMLAAWHFHLAFSFKGWISSLGYHFITKGKKLLRHQWKLTQKGGAFKARCMTCRFTFSHVLPKNSKLDSFTRVIEWLQLPSYLLVLFGSPKAKTNVQWESMLCSVNHIFNWEMGALQSCNSVTTFVKDPLG